MSEYFATEKGKEIKAAFVRECVLVCMCVCLCDCVRVLVTVQVWKLERNVGFDFILGLRHHLLSVRHWACQVTWIPCFLVLPRLYLLSCSRNIHIAFGGEIQGPHT